MTPAEPSPCPSRAELERLASSPGLPTGGGGAATEIAAHVQECLACRRELQAIRDENSLLAELRGANRDRIGGHSAGFGASPRPGPSSPFDAIPGYTIHRELQRGGQGVVYEATQDSTRRRVALKLLLRGPFATSRARLRFEREVEVIAALRDPGIVTLYDAGATREGGAFFAMELVEGATLDRHVASQRPSRSERLALFRAIVDAVDAAHRVGVTHRDLKPSNILVDRAGRPRVLDFGLARAVGRDPRDAVAEDAAPPASPAADQTLPGFVGTLAYAAPEQLAAENDAVDVRADVYALGVVLFELLVGARPFPPAQDAAGALAGRGESVPDEPLRRAGVDRDLRAILARATRRSAADRYASAAALADDLDRRRDRRPVAARGDALPYLLSRLASRHRAAVGVAASMALVISVAAVTLSVLLVDRDAQRRRAERTLAAIIDAIAAADPLAIDPAAGSVLEFLDGVGRRTDERLAEEPEEASRVHAALGEVALSRADLDRAEAHFASAHARSESAGDEEGLASAIHALARVRFFRGDYAGAEALYLKALSIRERLHGRADADVATTISHLASCRRRLGDPRGAESLLREALAIRESDRRARPEDVAAALNNLGAMLLDVGQADEAVALLERSERLIAASAGEDNWRTAHAQRTLAAARLQQGRLDEALAAVEGSLRIWNVLVDAGLLEATHPRRATALVLLARIQTLRGEAERAVEAAREGHAALLSRGGPAHADARDAAVALGSALRAAGRPGEAEPLLRETLEASRALAVAPAQRGAIAGELGACLAALGRFAEAEPLLLEAHAATRSAPGVPVDPRRAADAAQRLEALYEAWGRPDDAERWRS